MRVIENRRQNGCLLESTYQIHFGLTICLYSSTSKYFYRQTLIHTYHEYHILDINIRNKTQKLTTAIVINT